MLIAYALTDYDSKKTGKQETKFTPIGSAWKNKDGSLTVKLEASPLSGRIWISEQPATKNEAPSR